MNEVETAHEFTLDWIFTNPEAGFSEWLQGDNSMAEVYNTAKDPDDTCTWNSSELRTAFDRFMNQDEVSGCVVLFVDALDEYLGKDDEISQSLKRLLSSSQDKAMRIKPPPQCLPIYIWRLSEHSYARLDCRRH
ncbi:hypothetical protein F4809DRAFT_639864 [Biscogniauxia mediterranea]|nr:hypothetical protein F4809DRAFT_639864 [Biscogniauxia mediterranea]